jgi:quercetin dioxygenase-like cupin family protein
MEEIVTLFVTAKCDPPLAFQLFNDGMKRTHLQTQPFLWNIEDRGFPFLGAQVWIKAGTEQTGGAFNLFEAILPSGFETPLHIHYAEDVAIQVLEGALDLYWGADKKQAVAGSFFYQPRGIPHGFRVAGSGPARILYLTLPAGLDGFVLAHGRPLSDSDVPVSEAQYKIEVLGSLPV